MSGSEGGGEGRGGEEGGQTGGRRAKIKHWGEGGDPE